MTQDVQTHNPEAAPGSSFAISRLNAVAHGILSRHALLPWEDRGEYNALLSALIAEHAPIGATQHHLVEEIAGIMWRKRRLRMAEAAAHRRGLEKLHDSYRNTIKAALAHIRPTQLIGSVKDALVASDQDIRTELESVEGDTMQTRAAIGILEKGGQAAQANALAALRTDTRQWWERLVAGEIELDSHRRYSRDADGLRDFLQREVLGWLESRKAELENRDLIREQAFGESLNTDTLEKLARYEVHLDRKLEKMLGMLYRLKELGTTRENESVSQKDLQDQG